MEEVLEGFGEFGVGEGHVEAADDGGDGRVAGEGGEGERARSAIRWVLVGVE